MSHPPPDHTNDVDPDRYRDAEAQLGGADGVPKTTYVTGAGTEPERRKGDGPAAQVHGGGAPRPLLTLVLVLVALVALAYLMGVGR
jgi:hypothetical protein